MDIKFMNVKKEKKAKSKNEIIITHPDKIYWPEKSYTKQDLVDYYSAVSATILPYLKNRPLMMKRFPDGIAKESFVQKDIKKMHLPSWIDTILINHEEKDTTYILVQNKETLKFIANLGAIELHPFLSEIKTSDCPNYFVMDLDPEDVTFEEVIDTACTIHKIFDGLNMECLIKTSGKRGLHLCIPLNKKYTYKQVLNFGLVLAEYIHEQLPDITSLLRKPKDRKNKIYLDVFQNQEKQTVIAPYSARGTPYATVSTPLKWSEVKRGLKVEDFTIKNVPERLEKIGDIFLPVLKKGIHIEKVLKILSKKLKKCAAYHLIQDM
jgi:bifunctional non-homologous end joining protein LigD